MIEAIAEIEQISYRPHPLSASDLGRLAVLRHEVGAALIKKAPRALPPAPVEDFFAGVSDTPEISGAELTAAHVASGLRYHGVLVVRGLVAPAHVEQLRGLIDGRDWSTIQCPTDDNGEVIKGSSPMKCTTATLQALIEAYQDAGMADLMTEYLGERPVLLSERLQIDRQTIKDGLPWHQDGAFFGTQIGAVNCFLALDSCGVDAPGLSVVPRRFDKIIGVEPGSRAELGYGASVKKADVLKLAGPAGISTPILGPGDAILFDEMTLHRTGSSPNRPKPRSWAVTWFLAPSRFPTDRHPLWFGL